MSAARPPTRPAAGAPTVHAPGGRPARPPAALSPVHTSDNVAKNGDIVAKNGDIVAGVDGALQTPTGDRR